MRYFMFIDESGEANISNPDPRFNIFVLCGVLFREDNYTIFDKKLKDLKQNIFSKTDICFHSSEMRNKSGIYKIFQDADIMSNFYQQIGEIFTACDYTVFSCVIDKEKYKKVYNNKNNAYEESLKFICERGVSFIERFGNNHSLSICLEKRDKRKDSSLRTHYTNVLRYGTQYKSTAAFQICNPKLYFRGKEQNINGLQWADLIAYPIARKCLSPDKPQPTLDLFMNKFYCDVNGKILGYGFKRYP